MKKIFLFISAFFITTPFLAWGAPLIWSDALNGYYNPLAAPSRTPYVAESFKSEESVVASGELPAVSSDAASRAQRIEEKKAEIARKEKIKADLEEKLRAKKAEREKKITLEQAVSATVRIYTDFNNDKKPEISGSAVAFGTKELSESEQKELGNKGKYMIYFATAHHLARTTQDTTIAQFFLPDGKTKNIKLQPFAGNIHKDLILAYGLSDELLPTIPLADKKYQVNIQDPVTGIGCPKGSMPYAYSANSKNCIIDIDRIKGDLRGVRPSKTNFVTSYLPQGGASGGPLVNKDNQIIGICSMQIEDRNNPQKNCGLYTSFRDIYDLLANDPKWNYTITNGYIVDSSEKTVSSTKKR